MASINPTRGQFAALRDVPQDAPVLMINLLRFNKVAEYAAGDPESGAAPVSGERAETSCSRAASAAA